MRLVIANRARSKEASAAQGPGPERKYTMNGETNILSTLIVAAVLAAVVFLIVRKMIRDKRAGRNSCGCGCGSCPMSGSCHKQGKKA